MDVFRVFDSLNYVDNLLLGMEAVHKAGGVVQGEVCYTGDVCDEGKGGKYGIDYYLRIADQLINKGDAHVLGSVFFSIFVYHCRTTVALTDSEVFCATVSRTWLDCSSQQPLASWSER